MTNGYGPITCQFSLIGIFQDCRIVGHLLPRKTCKRKQCRMTSYDTTGLQQDAITLLNKKFEFDVEGFYFNKEIFTKISISISSCSTSYWKSVNRFIIIYNDDFKMTELNKTRILFKYKIVNFSFIEQM